MKKLLTSLILITLVLSCLSTRYTSAAANTAATLPLIERSGTIVRFAPRQIREANRRLRYTIKARYPQAIGVGDERLARLNQEIRDLITREVNDFKKDFRKPQGRFGPTGSDFEAAYAIELAASDLVSIRFGISSFYEGAAHPQHNTLVFNYDLKSGKRLKLSDLFKANSNYLPLISDYAVKALRKELSPDPDLDWIQSGAGPKEENYNNWNITPKGLQVTFDPYQVASYAQGEHVVVIPFSVLKDVIEQDSPLARITSRQSPK